MRALKFKIQRDFSSDLTIRSCDINVMATPSTAQGQELQSWFWGSEVRVSQSSSFLLSLKLPVLSHTMAAARLASQTAVIQLMDVTWGRNGENKGMWWCHERV